MKSKKLRALATCGLGVALAASLSPAAAFAVEGTTASTEGQDALIDNTSGEGQGSSDVNIFGQDTQISVTVPISLTVAASGAPGAKLAGSPTNYTLTNNSYFDIQVKRIAATPESGWDYVDTAVTKNTNVTEGNTGAIHLDLYSYNAKDAPSLTGTGTAVTAAGTDTSSMTGTTTNKWTIKGKTGAQGTPMPVGINGTTKLDKSIDTESTNAAKALTLTYTIARA